MATESQNLTKEASDAKAAIGRTVTQLKHELGQSADPRAWVKAHPWATLAAAAVAAFAAVELMVPSAEEKTIKHLATLEAAIRRETQTAAKPETNGNGSEPEPPERIHHKLLSTLAYAAFQAAKPLLTTLLTAIATRPEPPLGDENGVNDPTKPPAEPS